MANNKRPQAPSAEPWEQMTGETVQQYEKFCAYRDMRYIAPSGTGDLPRLDFTRERSIRGLARQLGLSRKTLEPLSARFQWVERCEAYDLYILRRLKEKGEAEILKMHENHAAIAAQMLKKAMRRLLTMQEEEIAASDMVRMVDVGVKIERLSRGESTERQEIGGETTVRHSGEVSVKPGNGLDLSGLSDEELGNLEQLLSKLHPE
ncbi:hypothetical protein [uncultured Oscillibacter sp.]|uniref:hypothetical protein n=1 Tax=uncultured Oscillibacter sp. TaxID=876091 RepID=UPI0023CA128D|nr:hypothetical protein [uncultured Oscillibacter sp.]MDE6931168.1 hypothetical protein [Oscillospiraceae bacterium]